MEAWIGLGSNLQNPAAQVSSAIQRLGQLECCVLKRCSGLYRTAPWGVVDQNDFCNAVAILDTRLPPGKLLSVLLDIEKDMGRERTGERWGPRCIDLDLLTFGDQVIKSPRLEIPHPRMHLRAFVLCPILELDPDFMIPGVGPAALCLTALEPRQDVTYSGPAPNYDDSGE